MDCCLLNSRKYFACDLQQLLRVEFNGRGEFLKALHNTQKSTQWKTSELDRIVAISELHNTQLIEILYQPGSSLAIKLSVSIETFQFIN